MELDELKILLKDQPAKMQLVKSTGEIAALMGNKTRSVTGKLRRSLKIEIISCIVFAVLCVAFGIFGSYTSLRIYFSIFAVACLLFLPFLFMLLKKTTKLSSTVLPVKSNLQNLLKIMQEFVKRYLQLTMALIPVSLIMAFLLGYADANLYEPVTQNPFFLNLNGSVLKTSLVIAYMIAFIPAMYYFTKCYLKKLYGNYLDQLQSLIKELEE